MGLQCVFKVLILCPTDFFRIYCHAGSPFASPNQFVLISFLSLVYAHQHFCSEVRTISHKLQEPALVHHNFDHLPFLYLNTTA